MDYFQQIGMHYIQMFVHDDLILISRLNFIQIYFKVQNFYSSINYGLKSKLLVERDIFLLHVHFFSNWITSWFQIEQLLHNYYTTITQLFLRSLPFCCTSTSILFHRPISARRTAVVRKLFSFSYVNFPKYDIILYRTNTHIKRISSSFSMLHKLWSTIFGGGFNIFIFLSVLMFFFSCECQHVHV